MKHPSPKPTPPSWGPSYRPLDPSCFHLSDGNVQPLAFGNTFAKTETIKKPQHTWEHLHIHTYSNQANRGQECKSQPLHIICSIEDKEEFGNHLICDYKDSWHSSGSQKKNVDACFLPQCLLVTRVCMILLLVYQHIRQDQKSLQSLQSFDSSYMASYNFDHLDGGWWEAFPLFQFLTHRNSQRTYTAVIPSEWCPRISS